MFNVKFMRFYQDGSSNVHSFSCDHYSCTAKKEGFYLITVYPTFMDTGGIERVVSDNDRDFDSCYIENQKGKTIEAFKKTEANPID